MIARSARALVLLALVIPVSRAAGPTPAPPARLSPQDLRLLRRAAMEAPGLPGSGDPVGAVDAWLIAQGSAPERDAIVEQLRRDAPLRLALTEIGRVRLAWRSQERGRFVAWWNPSQRDAAGASSEGLSATDAAALGVLLERTAHEIGTEPPEGVPYQLDFAAQVARVRGPDDLRWGIVTPDPRDRQAVVKLVLLELGSAPYVVDTLSTLRACEDRTCRREILDAARRTIIQSGYVPIVDGLGAAAFAGPGDPAFASALLVVDHVDRLHPARTFGELLRTLSPGATASDLRRLFFQATGEPPRKLDRLVQAEVAEWARHSAP